MLAGRPYHVDPEVNHGIDQLIIRQGAAVISEDSVSWHEQKFQTSVLNQWTYHSRLYAAAKYCTENPDMDLVQLVSFGCGLDAVTTDETREILQAGSKLYTQLKDRRDHKSGRGEHKTAQFVCGAGRTQRG